MNIILLNIPAANVKLNYFQVPQFFYASIVLFFGMAARGGGWGQDCYLSLNLYTANIKQTVLFSAPHAHKYSHFFSLPNVNHIPLFKGQLAPCKDFSLSFFDWSWTCLKAGVSCARFKVLSGNSSYHFLMDSTMICHFWDAVGNRMMCSLENKKCQPRGEVMWFLQEVVVQTSSPAALTTFIVCVFLQQRDLVHWCALTYF